MTYSRANVVPGGNVRPSSSSTTSKLGTTLTPWTVSPGAVDVGADAEGFDELHAASKPTSRTTTAVRLICG